MNFTTEILDGEKLVVNVDYQTRPCDCTLPKLSHWVASREIWLCGQCFRFCSFERGIICEARHAAKEIPA